jgi:diguanylate cyclase (GGDEF)-like protein
MRTSRRVLDQTRFAVPGGRMTVYVWFGRHLRRLGYVEKLVLVAIAAISVPLLTVMAAGSILADPGLDRTMGWVFAMTAAATIAFVCVATRLLEPIRLATRQLGSYLERRELPGVAVPVADEAGLLLSRVSEACHRMEWERMIFVELAVTDPSGVLNRRGGVERIDALRSAAPRAARWTVGIVEVDDLDGLVEAHGHRAGDRALRSVAERLESLPVPQTIVARWVGDAFLVVSPCRVETMEVALGTVSADLGRSSVLDPDRTAVTFSAGLARGRIHDSLDGPLEQAADALRAAWRAGGCRVVHGGPRLVRRCDGIRA